MCKFAHDGLRKSPLVCQPLRKLKHTMHSRSNCQVHRSPPRGTCVIHVRFAICVTRVVWLMAGASTVILYGTFSRPCDKPCVSGPDLFSGLSVWASTHHGITLEVRLAQSTITVFWFVGSTYQCRCALKYLPDVTCSSDVMTALTCMRSLSQVMIFNFRPMLGVLCMIIYLMR